MNNKKLVDQWADEAGHGKGQRYDDCMMCGRLDLERFAQLVADHELEAAAKACEARAKDAPAPLAAECLLCAVAIRAMKGNP